MLDVDQAARSHPRSAPRFPRGACRRKMPRGMRALAVLLACLTVAAPARAFPAHGIAMHGNPKHAPGFAHFPYVNPDAPKGGRLVLGALGTFDSLNPFIVKGVTPGDLREYVYESLMARS